MKGNQDARIMQLEQCGIELWTRAERWKTALLEIKTLTRDRLILDLVEQTLNGDYK